MKMNQVNPVFIESSFNTSIENLWEAITVKDQMRQWFFENIPSFNPEEGFQTQFNVESNGRIFLHQWKVMKVILKKKLMISWMYGGYPGESLVIFDLMTENRLAKLQLTHEGIETFPDNIPEFERESCEKGWNYFIKKQLKDFLNK